MKLAPPHLALSRFLDPALVLLVLLAVALYVGFRGAVLRDAWARRARVAAWCVWAAMWVLTTPAASARLVSLGEMRGPPLAEALAGRDLDRAAMVVLAAGMRTYDPEVPLRERLDDASTQRVLTGARLWERHRFGMVVLSGSPEAQTECMQDLITALGVPEGRIVRERRSRNTRENARFTAEILRARGVETVVLVTSATHLKRAVNEFARAGIAVIPAAAQVTGNGRLGIDMFLPSSSSMSRTHMVIHELLGRLRP